jgi:hypothetical protein
MTAINRLYASSGSEVIIGTLQIDIGGQTHYLCEGMRTLRRLPRGRNRNVYCLCHCPFPSCQKRRWHAGPEVYAVQHRRRCIHGYSQGH